jgi:hypothetical protein
VKHDRRSKVTEVTDGKTLLFFLGEHLWIKGDDKFLLPNPSQTLKGIVNASVNMILSISTSVLTTPFEMRACSLENPRKLVRGR